MSFSEPLVCNGIWMVEHGQQFGLVGVQPPQQAIETDEAGGLAKEVVKPGTELAAPAWCRAGAGVLEIGVELPDQARTRC
jgi:hypothetical protein